jgi:hypothetical protein
MDLQQGIESTQRCLRQQIRRGIESRNLVIQNVRGLGERSSSRGHTHSKSVQVQTAENDRNPFHSFLGKQGTSSDCRSNTKEKALPT